MKGTHIAEGGHVVNILAPVDINGGKNSDVFSMKDHAHVDILIQNGVNAAASTVTVEECDDFVPTAPVAIAFHVYKEETAAGDTLGARTAVAATGFAMGTNNGIMYVIGIDAAELSAGKPNLRVVFSDPSGSVIASAAAILSGARYGSDQSATEIA